jgi:hypothetical protein
MIITAERFIKLTDLVIQWFESGYYHPDMAKKMKASDQKKLAASGETMFGLDRKEGASLSKYPEWAEFWAVIDKANARKNWPHYYLGETRGPQLRALASKIMYGWFSELFNRHITEKGKIAVFNDDRLIIHFSYASWNGEGWFERFAVPLNEAVNKQALDKENIFHAAIVARTKALNKNGTPNLTIRKHGQKMLALFQTMQ